MQISKFIVFTLSIAAFCGIQSIQSAKITVQNMTERRGWLLREYTSGDKYCNKPFLPYETAEIDIDSHWYDPCSPVSRIQACLGVDRSETCGTILVTSPGHSYQIIVNPNDPNKVELVDKTGK